MCFVICVVLFLFGGSEFGFVSSNVVSDMAGGKRTRLFCLVEDGLFDCDNVIGKGCRCTVDRVRAHQDLQFRCSSFGTLHDFRSDTQDGAPTRSSAVVGSFCPSAGL